MVSSLKIKNPQRSIFLLLLSLTSLVIASGVTAQSPSWEWVANGRLTGTFVAGGITTHGIGLDKNNNVFFGGAIADPSVVGPTTLTSVGGNDIFLAKTNASGVIQWARSFGTVNWDQMIDMITDTAGNVYAQLFFGSPSFNIDGQIVTSLIFGSCIAKFDSNGTCVRAKTTHTIATMVGGLAYSPMGFMATVSATSVVKTNMNCDTIWTRTIPTGLNAQVLFYDVTIDHAGNIIACGTFGGSAQFGSVTLTTPSNADLDDFVVKYNTNGMVIWAKQFGVRSPHDEYAYAVAVDKGNHVYVTGNYREKIGIGTDTLRNTGLLETMYLLKFSPTGTLEHAMNGTSTNANYGRQVTCDANNNMWLAINPSGTVHFAGVDHIPFTSGGTMIISIDTAGNFRGRLKTDGLGYSDPKRILFNSAGTAFYVGGYHIATDPAVVSFGTTTLKTGGCYIAKATPGVTTDVGDDENLPTNFSLEQNYPNPFNPTTTIAFTLKERSDVKIEIFNVLGQRVRALLNETKGAGAYQLEWNGTDGAGNPVATGMYLYRLAVGDVVQTKKMMLLK